MDWFKLLTLKPFKLLLKLFVSRLVHRRLNKLSYLLVYLNLLDVLSVDGVKRVSHLMWDSGIDEGEQLLLPVRDIIHDVFRHVDDLKNLALFIILKNDFSFYLVVFQLSFWLAGFFVILYLRLVPVFVCINLNMIKHKNHLMKLLSVYLAQIVKRVYVSSDFRVGVWFRFCSIGIRLWCLFGEVVLVKFEHFGSNK